jgi:signal transduction histidine kinase
MRVEQVLNNLVSNAIKYSPHGGKVTLRLDRDRESALFSVSDEGIGISPEDRERLFVPFRRGGATSAWIPGVGLGLCVAKRITEAHGGRIEVESAADRGSTFRVRLPLAKARVAAEAGMP